MALMIPQYRFGMSNAITYGRIRIGHATQYEQSQCYDTNKIAIFSSPSAASNQMPAEYWFVLPLLFIFLDINSAFTLSQ